MILNKRQVHILQTIICTPGTGGETLAARAGISTRTLTADLETINDEIKAYGLFIENRRGAGYFCTADQEETLKYIKTQLICRDYFTFHEENDFSERVGEIIRILLTASDYVKTDDIAETLWLTRSSINQELKDARKILKKYNLSLETKPHHGIKITGQEASMRQCMVDFCKPYFHTLDPIPFLEDGYSRYGFSHDKVKEIYHLLVNSFKARDLRVSDQALQRLVIMVLVVEQRISTGKTVHMPDEYLTAIPKTIAWQTADTVLSQTIPSIPNTEICFFSLIILANADFFHTPGYLLEDCGRFYIEAIDLFDQLQAFFRDKLYIVFSGDIQFSHGLLKLLLQFVIRKQLSLYEYEYGGPAYEHAGRLPASRQLACEALIFLESITGYAADQYIMINFTLLFYNTVMSIPSNRKRLKMLCVGPHNLYYSRSIGYKIKSQHHNYIDSIEYCTPYELSQLDLRKYDYIITSEPPEVLPAQDILPVMELNYFLSWRDLYDFRNQVVLPKISMDTLMAEVTQSGEEPLIECGSLDDFITCAASAQGLAPNDTQQLLHCHQLLPILPSDGCVALCCFFQPPGQKWSTKMFRFKEPVKYHSQSIQYAVICLIPLDFDTQILKMADSLLRRILLNEDGILPVPKSE